MTKKKVKKKKSLGYHQWREREAYVKLKRKKKE